MSIRRVTNSKTQVSLFVSFSIFTSCIMMQPALNLVKERSSSWIWDFDQRCNINLIGEKVLSRIVFLQESAIDWHHECITVWSYETICFIWVDWLHYKWSLPFGLEFSFYLMCHYHRSSDSYKTRSPFLKVRSLTFLLKALVIRAW